MHPSLVLLCGIIPLSQGLTLPQHIRERQDPDHILTERQDDQVLPDEIAPDFNNTCPGGYALVLSMHFRQTELDEPAALRRRPKTNRLGVADGFDLVDETGKDDQQRTCKRNVTTTAPITGSANQSGGNLHDDEAWSNVFQPSDTSPTTTSFTVSTSTSTTPSVSSASASVKVKCFSDSRRPPADRSSCQPLIDKLKNRPDSGTAKVVKAAAGTENLVFSLTGQQCELKLLMHAAGGNDTFSLQDIANICQEIIDVCPSMPQGGFGGKKKLHADGPGKWRGYEVMVGGLKEAAGTPAHQDNPNLAFPPFVPSLAVIFSGAGPDDTAPIHQSSNENTATGSSAPVDPSANRPATSSDFNDPLTNDQTSTSTSQMDTPSPSTDPNAHLNCHKTDALGGATAMECNSLIDWFNSLPDVNNVKQYTAAQVVGQNYTKLYSTCQIRVTAMMKTNVDSFSMKEVTDRARALVDHCPGVGGDAALHADKGQWKGFSVVVEGVPPAPSGPPSGAGQGVDTSEQ